jgi:uncharacterized protein (TIGR03437 family)
MENMNHPRLHRRICFIVISLGMTVVAMQAQTLTTLLSFSGTNGMAPSILLQAADGNLYGETQSGGPDGSGEIFKLTSAGTLTILASFKFPTVPVSLMLAKEGNFYGTTNSDGINGKGTIFKMTPAGTLTTLYQFAGDDGNYPIGGLIQGTDGSFYGTTAQGGSNPLGLGTIFQMTPGGALTTLYSFNGSDGAWPYASLIESADGNFYGTTRFGGGGPCIGRGEGSAIPNGCGTIFKITPGGMLATLYAFKASSDSGFPMAPLIQGVDGNLYGTTTGAGSLAFNGTFFRISPSGVLTTLHDFTSDSQHLGESSPLTALVLGPEGSFYGATTSFLYKVTPTGTLTNLQSFCSQTECPYGYNPEAVVLATDGNLYGAMTQGGASADGTIFKLSLASGPAAPSISLVANAEGEAPVISANTWVEIKGSLLAPAGFSSPDCAPGYCWQAKDFVNNQMPTNINGVSVTVNGKNAFLYYISPTQINILTPPDALSGQVQVQVTNNSAASTPFNVQTQSMSPSFFVFDGTHVAAVHLNGTFIGPTTLYPGLSFPAKPNETIVLYANGFGPTTPPVVSGSASQSGNLSPFPSVKIGGFGATVGFAGLVAPGEFQFNITVPGGVPDGDQAIVATYNGFSTQAAAVITIQH